MSDWTSIGAIADAIMSDRFRVGRNSADVSSKFVEFSRLPAPSNLVSAHKTSRRRENLSWSHHERVAAVKRLEAGTRSATEGA